MDILKLALWILVTAPLITTSLGKHYSKEDINDLAKIFEKWALNLHNKVEKKIFDEAIKNFSLKDIPQPVSLDKLPPEKETAACTLCKVTLQALFNSYQNKSATHEQTYTAGTKLCQMIFGFREEICRAYVNINLPIFLYIVDHDSTAKASSFCGLIYQSENPNDCPLEDKRFEFTVDVPPYQPSWNWRKERKTQKNLKSIKLVHLSDAHVDPLYEAGGVAYCGDPLCCRKGQNATAGSTKAGYWGDYGVCDSPKWAFEDALGHIQENIKDIDVVIYTGDSADHAIWESTYKSIEDVMTYVANKFKQTFPNKDVYPTLGNHDSHPQNAFALNTVINPRFSSDWLYELVIKLWAQWLPPSTFKTIRKGGYYTALAKPGWRIIALNSNIGYKYNWWIVLNPDDPNDQLQWLCDTLYKAEREGEIVTILSHIPPGTTDSYEMWIREYVRIINRFAHIIANEFNGHTHTDEFKLYYDTNTQKPTHVAWNGGSLVTYYFYNTNYKVFYMDPYTFETIDYDNYSYNLTEANLTPNKRPPWSKTYSFKDAYGIDSLRANDIDKLVNKFATNKTLLRKYVDRTGKEGDVFLAVANGQRKVLGADYDFEYICNMVTTDVANKKKCNQVKLLYDASP